MLSFDAVAERHRLATPFRISRGVRTEVEVVTVAVSRAGRTGRGEGVPYARYGESAEGVLAQLAAVSGRVEELDRQGVQDLLPPGSARNALDCALWDLEGREAGPPPYVPVPIISAMTVSLDVPNAMQAAAARAIATGARLLKAKVDGTAPEAQLRAVRAGAPAARLIADANEGWSFEQLRTLQPLLAELRVELVEQPLPVGEDEPLEGFSPAVPLCADESCHTAADLERVARRYQAVNIKLDKTGGLTAAFELRREARRRGLLVMVGCMISTSRSIAPTALVAQGADYADLDGPLWLARDLPGGVAVRNGLVHPPSAELWDGRAAARGQPA